MNCLRLYYIPFCKIAGELHRPNSIRPFSIIIFTTNCVAGWIVDQTGRLDLVFHVSGATFFLATVTMVISVKLKDRLREKYT